jgi:hypothetical protein
MNQASNLGPATSVYFASDPRPFLDRAARPMILLAADFQIRLPWVGESSSTHLPKRINTQKSDLNEAAAAADASACG